MFRRLSHIVLVLLLLSACGRQKGYSPLLLNSDSLCNVRPDSALVLLQQLSLLTRGLSPCAQNVKDKKIITIFSDMPATSIHVKGYKIPWR